MALPNTEDEGGVETVSIAGINASASIEDGSEGESAKKSADRVRDKGAWWEHAIVASVVIGGAILFLFLFSALPWCRGHQIFETLSDSYEYCLYALGAAVVFTFALLVLDVRFWHGPWRLIAVAMMGLSVLGFGAAALLATKAFVVAPVGLFLLGGPFVLMLIKTTVFDHIDVASYLVTLEASLVVVGVGALTAWLVWILSTDHWWGLDVKIEFYGLMDCNLTAVEATLGAPVDQVALSALSSEARDALDSQVVGCTAAFMLWLLPFVLVLWSFVFAAVLFFLVRTLKQAREAKDKAHAMDPLAQGFVMLVALGLFGLWAAAGIAGAEMSLTNVILALTFVAMIVMGVVVAAVFGTGAIQEGLGNTPLGNRMLRAMTSDWVKAIMLMLISPFFLVYLGCSVLTQLSRKHFSCTKKLSAEDRELFFTARATRYLAEMRSWNWTSVFVKVIWLGLFFFLLSVGVVRVTTLFLSWLNAELLTVPLAATTFVFIGVGTLMFLNPFIPGVPVYVSGGIILVSSAQDLMSFWGAVAFTMAICFGLKMSAIVIQQKIIGETFAYNRVWIRRLVAVNSVETRSIRLILLQPGMSLRKVSVLCGGPDWPVSVLTGILRLPLGSMLYGSLPVFFLIAPCVVAGALLLRSSEGGIWGSLSTMSLAAAFVVQSAAMLAAIHFIAKTIIEREEELKQWDDDQEVLELERASEYREKLRERITHWSQLDQLNRGLLVVSAGCMTVSCYIFQLFGSQCFVTFKVSDSIDEVLGGDPLRLVKDLGWVALAIFAYPCCYLIFFRCYTARLLSAAEKAEGRGDLIVAGADSASSDSDSDAEAGGNADDADRQQELERKICCSMLRRNVFFCIDSRGN